MKRLQPSMQFNRTKAHSKPFDEMNDIIANTILNLTCSSRFPGSLNVDINEIIMNMTPYPRLHYLISSTSPLFPLNDSSKVDHMFNEVFSISHQLFQCSPSLGIMLASALLCRGQVAMSDVQHNIERLKGNIKFVPWNKRRLENWFV
ncbi:tubulin epsilon chain [Caerostris extrusa]|uniref:Tubulin epsilon chain n=1 Tax=Caerostris extrusa TaxID=172846 RepID=A0AAV4RT01_CAEEX|nr:tubulin epsilon chain [Caerostris extrusa]